MPTWLGAILPLIKSLVSGITSLVQGLFLINVGKEKQQLANYKAEDKKENEVKQIGTRIDGMSDDELRQLLSAPKSTSKRKPSGN
jgi:hypothetical protein